MRPESSPDGIPMLNMAKPVVTPLPTPAAPHHGPRNSVGLKGIIMGERDDVTLAGSRKATDDGFDALKEAVNEILLRQAQVTNSLFFEVVVFELN